MTSQDPEIEAMARVKDALASLDDETREHVIRWAAERFGLSLGRKRSAMPAGGALLDGEYEDVGTFFTQASPSTAAEKALAVGYWFQVLKGQDSFDGASVNAELKNLGHGVSNITRAFDDLKARRPALAIQVQKSGKAKQARKKYKITEAGMTKVQKMVSGEVSGSEEEES